MSELLAFLLGVVIATGVGTVTDATLQWGPAGRGAARMAVLLSAGAGLLCVIPVSP